MVDLPSILEATKKLLGEEYVQNFLVRDRGSTWSLSEKEFLSLPFEEKTDLPEIVTSPGCRYLQCTLPEYIKAFSGILDIEFLKESGVSFDYFASHVLLQEGKHGAELITTISNSTQANQSWCILGICQEEQVIYTAYPGKLTASIKKFSGKSAEELIAMAWNGVPFAIKCVQRF